MSDGHRCHYDDEQPTLLLGKLDPGTRAGTSQHHRTPEGWKELMKIFTKVSDNQLDS